METRTEPGTPAHREDTPTAVGRREQPDDRVVRRARRAGLVVGVASAVLLTPFGLLSGGGGGAALVWLLSSLVVGLLVASGWLVLALLLDLISGSTPGRRRLVITAAVFAAAFVSPVLPVAALRALAGS